MGDTRKAKRAVMITRESAGQVLAGIADGLKKGEVAFEGQHGRIIMVPGPEAKLQVNATKCKCCGSKGSVQVKVKWERPRTLREKSQGSQAAAAKPASKR